MSGWQATTASAASRLLIDDHLYRRGVGVMLLNADKLVFVGRRIVNRNEAWQMPQGGTDEGEDSWAAALRELKEETGIKAKTFWVAVATRVLRVCV